MLRRPRTTSGRGVDESFGCIFGLAEYAIESAIERPEERRLAGKLSGANDNQEEKGESKADVFQLGLIRPDFLKAKHILYCQLERIRDSKLEKVEIMHSDNFTVTSTSVFVDLPWFAVHTNRRQQSIRFK